MAKKILVIDTSILCAWFRIPGKETCGPRREIWDHSRVQAKLDAERQSGSTFVLPLAAIIETGNHITHISGDRRHYAERLAEIMRLSADQTSPWTAFGDQAQLWTPEHLKELADTWPDLAVQKKSLADVTIMNVAEFYAQAGYAVELLTGDQGLKAHEPAQPPLTPRRRLK